MNLPSGLHEFLDPQCNRAEFIQKYLLDLGLKSTAVVLEGRSHIYVDLPKDCYDSKYKIKTLVAHYDRVHKSPGANDNSSGVFALLNAAKYFTENHGIYNIRMIFTDAEEEGRFGVTSQGAFALAKKFKDLGTMDGEVFVFDCVGRGDVPVLCALELPSNAEPNLKRNYVMLQNQIRGILSSYSSSSPVEVPASFSDNAGFLANGIAACAITMLPRDEVSNYMSNLSRIPGLAESVMNRRLEDVPDKIAPEYKLRESIPLTWRYFHTCYDTETTLTPVSFSIIQKVIIDIARINFIK